MLFICQSGLCKWRLSKFVNILARVLAYEKAQLCIKDVWNNYHTFYYCWCISPVLAKVYKEADVEETGVVDAAKVPSLATKILGNSVTEHETRLVVQKTEAKGGSGEYSINRNYNLFKHP